MATEIKVPMFPESISDGTVATWYKKPGETVKMGDTIVDLETDKVVLEVPAPVDGTLEKILKETGTVVKAQEVLGVISEGAAKKTATETAQKAEPKVEKKIEAKSEINPQAKSEIKSELSPSARRLAGEFAVNTAQISGSGKAGKVTKDDIKGFMQKGQSQSSAAEPVASSQNKFEATMLSGERPEKRVPMSRLRARIAERLLQAQHNAAILTTFNEVNMQSIIELRTRYRDAFEKKHGVRLGFMSFFVHAAVEALKRFPEVNASVDGNDVVYHGYYDIGVAVSTDRGLVVPILRDADKMTFADIERKIAEYAQKARDGKLAIEEMTGGTFTITNGGVFGSLLATPIINPPQTAILGMHKIQDRAVVENGQIVARPMMYLALSYDHRLIDGKDSVKFLVTLKELLEYPARSLFDV